MVRALLVSTALVTTACSAGPMAPCVTTATVSCTDQADQQGKEVAAAVVGGILLIAMAKLIYELVPLGVYLHQRPH